MNTVERPAAPLESWERYLRDRFPGYLLPESAAERLSPIEASRFLQALSGRSDALTLLRGAGLFATRAERLRAFLRGSLAHLVAQLPSCTNTHHRRWNGGYHGRLHVGETVALRIQGDHTSFVTLANKRSFDLPENILLRHLCRRLLDLLALLREAEVMREGSGWATPLLGCEGELRRAVVSSVLGRVSDEPITTVHENAALAARHFAYHEAVAWLSLLRAEFDDRDHARVARTVATSGLLPLSAAKRFEIAVLIRLGDVLATQLDAREPGRWRVERDIIRKGREDIYALVRDDGVTVRLFYDHSALPAGEIDQGRRYYLNLKGRLRPDVTISFERDGVRFNAVVVECKCSDNTDVLSAGFNEAALYRHEYREHLRMKPKALLVVPGGQPPSLHPDDDVAVESWSGWPSENLVGRLVQTAVS